MRVRQLCEVWQLWKMGGAKSKFTATLADGSAISAVGRPHSFVCEVHSARGVENRQSDETVMCEELDTKKDTP